MIPPVEREVLCGSDFGGVLGVEEFALGTKEDTGVSDALMHCGGPMATRF